MIVSRSCQTFPRFWNIIYIASQSLEQLAVLDGEFVEILLRHIKRKMGTVDAATEKEGLVPLFPQLVDHLFGGRVVARLFRRIRQWFPIEGNVGPFPIRHIESEPLRIVLQQLIVLFAKDLLARRWIDVRQEVVREALDQRREVRVPRSGIRHVIAKQLARAGSASFFSRHRPAREPLFHSKLYLRVQLIPKYFKSADKC